MKPTALLKAIALAAGLYLNPAHAAAAAPQPQTLSFDLLAKTTVKEPPAPAMKKGVDSLRGPIPHEDGDGERIPAFPADLQQLEGKRVKIEGFVAPYDNPDSMTKMILLRTVVGCFFCNPPKESEVVFVRLSSNEKPINMDNNHLSVEGTLHLLNAASKDQEAKQFFFTIDEAKVTALAE
jgi:hypothetical protein